MPSGVAAAGLDALPQDPRNFWYPVGFSSHIPVPPHKIPARSDPDNPPRALRPTAATLLNQPLVLWRGPTAKLHCVEDKCPHRSVPLSLGKVNGGTLECKYHGWRVKGDGSVCFIPSLGGAPPPPSTTSTSSSCPNKDRSRQAADIEDCVPKCHPYRARRFPVLERDDVVYVWMGDAEDVDLQEKRAPVADAYFRVRMDDVFRRRVFEEAAEGAPAGAESGEQGAASKIPGAEEEVATTAASARATTLRNRGSAAASISPPTTTISSSQQQLASGAKLQNSTSRSTPSHQQIVPELLAGLNTDLRTKEYPFVHFSDFVSFADKNYVRQDLIFDLPIPHELLMENLLDPAHIPFAHDGTIGRRGAARSINMVVFAAALEHETTNCSQKVQHRGFLGVGNSFVSPAEKAATIHPKRPNHYNGSFLAFFAPCLIVLHTPLSPQRDLDLWQFASCIPTSKTRMRLVYRAYRNWLARPQFLWRQEKLFWGLVPNFFKTLMDGFSQKIVFQDYELLYGQLSRLNQGANAWHSWLEVDELPRLYRTWWEAACAEKTIVPLWFRSWGGETSGDAQKLAAANCGTSEKWGFAADGSFTTLKPFHPVNPFPNDQILVPCEKRSWRVGVIFWAALWTFSLLWVGAVVGVLEVRVHVLF